MLLFLTGDSLHIILISLCRAGSVSSKCILDMDKTYVVTIISACFCVPDFCMIVCGGGNLLRIIVKVKPETVLSFKMCLRH